MAKTATLTVRLDEDLKNEAQQVFDGMGLPMSLAVELYLRQVVAKHKLPFALGAEEPDEDAEREREQKERDLWKSFMLWYFKVWPMFDSPKMRERAESDFGFDQFNAGMARLMHTCLDSVSADDPSKVILDKRALTRAIYQVQSLLSEAKDLLYWAMGEDRVVVPQLAGRYSSDADLWRYQYLREQAWDVELDTLEMGLNELFDQVEDKYVTGDELRDWYVDYQMKLEAKEKSGR